MDAIFVAPLERLGRDDLAWAGGKGANLGEMVKSGFLVPRGFVVTTDAYDYMLERTGLGRTIAATLAEGPKTGAAIREAFLAADVPRRSNRRSSMLTAIFWALVLSRYDRARRPRTCRERPSPASRTPT
jgi:phosphoenolpyruvate synthase/pyruvate phosphate dikinase